MTTGGLVCADYVDGRPVQRGSANIQCARCQRRVVATPLGLKDMVDLSLVPLCARCGAEILHATPDATVIAKTPLELVALATHYHGLGADGNGERD